MSVQRSPPRTPTTPSGHSKSESELSKDMFVNTKRQKRFCPDGSPEQPLCVNKNDLQSLLEGWKKEQDNNISSLISEQSNILAKVLNELADIKTQNLQIKKTNEEIKKSNTEIEKSLAFMSQQFDDMKREIDTLKKGHKEQKSYIETLERKLNDTQLRSRSSGVEIRNIPQEISETHTVLVNTVTKLGETVGLPISKTDVRDIYRLPRKTNPGPVVVEFSTVEAKQKLITAVRHFNEKKPRDDKLNTTSIGKAGKKQPIYVSEQVPPSVKRLFNQAREFAKEHGYKFCWISNGNILLRKEEGNKPILIRTEKCLSEALRSPTPIP